MVVTRSQANQKSGQQGSSTHESKTETKSTAADVAKAKPETTKSKSQTTKPKQETTKSKPKPELTKSKSNKKSQSADLKSVNSETCRKLIEAHGKFPLEYVSLDSPTEVTSATIMAHILGALLSAVPLSHELAAKALEELIRRGYHDTAKLHKSTWEERTKVLVDGGYSRYRERSATSLGHLDELLTEKYDGDATKIVEIPSGSNPDEARKIVAERIKEINGIGDLGAEIFFSTAQAIVPEFAPFVSSRDMESAKELDLGDENDMFEAVGRDAVLMAKLSTALTSARFEGSISQFK